LNCQAYSAFLAKILVSLQIRIICNSTSDHKLVKGHIVVRLVD